MLIESFLGYRQGEIALTCIYDEYDRVKEWVIHCGDDKPLKIYTSKEWDTIMELYERF